MIAVHLGEVSEEKILEMRYDFYQNVIKELSIKFNFDSTTSLLANPYCEKASEYVNNSNPMNYIPKEEQKKSKVTIGTLLNMGLLNDK